MADIVFGAGTSHSPMLLFDAQGWLAWGESRDPQMTDLAGGDGAVRPFQEWVEHNQERMRAELTDEVLASKVARCAAAVAELARRIAAASLETLIIVGDDQSEHLFTSNLPPFLVHHGDGLPNGPSPFGENAPALMQAMGRGYYEPNGPCTYDVDTSLARHLVEHLLDAGFDIASSDRLPGDRPEGHAFQYVHRHLAPAGVATVAIMLNTYLPPAQPRARRCVQLGSALRTAVAAVEDDRRVGIIASGGLSHFLISEDLDRRVLGACAAKDLDALGAIPEAVLQSGTSEIKNWMVAAAACGHLDFDLIDYVPGYRTPAGTGTALAFATWSPS